MISLARLSMGAMLIFATRLPAAEWPVAIRAGVAGMPRQRQASRCRRADRTLISSTARIAR